MTTETPQEQWARESNEHQLAIEKKGIIARLRDRIAWIRATLNLIGWLPTR